jgi:hypothetical protein
MPSNSGVPGLGVTPLVAGAAVSGSNPLPVQLAGGTFPVPVNAQQEAVLTSLAVGANLVAAAVPGKRIFVTGYNFSIPVADTVSFRSNAAIISAQGVGVVGGNEAAGSEAYLFVTVAGEPLNFYAGLAAATAGLQVRYRVES